MKEKDNQRNPNVDGRIILRWFLGTYDIRVWSPLISIRKGCGGCCDEHSISISGRK
jgi:hypothetical protein